MKRAHIYLEFILNGCQFYQRIIVKYARKRSTLILFLVGFVVALRTVFSLENVAQQTTVYINTVKTTSTITFQSRLYTQKVNDKGIQLFIHFGYYSELLCSEEQSPGTGKYTIHTQIQKSGKCVSSFFFSFSLYLTFLVCKNVNVYQINVDGFSSSFFVWSCHCCCLFVCLLLFIWLAYHHHS